MRKFANSVKITARQLAEMAAKAAVEKADKLEQEAKAAGLSVIAYTRLKNAQARQAEIRAGKPPKGNQNKQMYRKPQRQMTRSAEPLKFKELPKKQYWDGQKWVALTVLEKVS